MSNIIKQAYIFTKGDGSVGLGGESASLVADGDHLLDLNEVDEDHRPAVLERFRNKLKEAFSEIWDEPAIVRFDFETND